MASFEFLPAQLQTLRSGSLEDRVFVAWDFLSPSLLGPSGGLALGGTVLPLSREMHTVDTAILTFGLLGLKQGEAWGRSRGATTGVGRSQAGTAAGGRVHALGCSIRGSGESAPPPPPPPP